MMITRKPIRIEDHVARVYHPGAGAWVWFAGTVRDTNPRKPVYCLEYETFEILAKTIMAEIIKRTILKYELLHASCIHRIGKVGIGETAVLVITSATHKEPASKGNLYLMSAVKEEVPIWKKEYWEDGTYSWG